MLDRALNPDKVRSIRPYPAPEHVLAPDGRTADRFLGGHVALFGDRYAAACAFAAMVPYWLAFLESRALIDAGVRERSLADVHGVVEDVAKVAAREVPGAGALELGAGLADRYLKIVKALPPLEEMEDYPMPEAPEYLSAAEPAPTKPVARRRE